MAEIYELTPQEMEVIDMLSKAYEVFLKLDNNDDVEKMEFCQHINTLQRHVLSRIAKRVYSVSFKPN